LFGCPIRRGDGQQVGSRKNQPDKEENFNFFKFKENRERHNLHLGLKKNFQKGKLGACIELISSFNDRNLEKNCN
jgi:hypothetical protein